MSPDPDIRASDADRDRVAEMLREHCAQGRITMDELEERLEATYAARTLGALGQVTADLPEEDLYELPVPAKQRATQLPVRRSPGELSSRTARAAWASWAAVNLVCFTVWLLVGITSGAWYPWWIWVAGPWGAVMLAGQIFGTRGPR